MKWRWNRTCSSAVFPLISVYIQYILMFNSLFSDSYFHILLNHTHSKSKDHLEHASLSKVPTPISYFDSEPLQMPALISSYLFLSLSLSHIHKCTHPLPPACIYLFVIFRNSVWRMSDSLTLHSARLIERHNIYVAETANYPTIYHPDYLSDWKLLVHVIGIIWN